MSQMGIANAVAIARSNVPRAIAGMREQGHLIERQAHVTGVSRKRHSSFLTEAGPNIANDIVSLTHISEPTRPEGISYAVFCLKKKKIYAPEYKED